MPKAFGILNGTAWREAGRLGYNDAILQYDEWWLGADGMASLRATFDPDFVRKVEERAFLYFDRWGAPYFSIAELPYPAWAPGPGDLYSSVPRIRSERGPYPYRVDEFFSERFARAVFNVAGSPIYAHVKGIGVDDFTGDVNWWNLSDEEARIVWPTAPRPLVRNWDLERLRVEESYVRSLCALRGKRVMVNGSARRMKGPRMFEGFGQWESPESVGESAQPGDAIVVKGIRGDRESWDVTRNAPHVSGFPIGTSFLEVFQIAFGLAESKGCSLCLALSERPYDNPGGSLFSAHKFFDPRTWEAL